MTRCSSITFRQLLARIQTDQQLPLPRQGPHKLHRLAQPLLENHIIFNIVLVNHHPTLQGLARGVEVIHTSLLQRVAGLFVTQAKHERLFPDSDHHVALMKEPQAAEHALVGDVGVAIKAVAQAVSEGRAVGQGSNLES